jgi:hypothetical protein
MIIRRRRVDTLGVSQWAVVTAILAAATGMLAGARFDVLAQVNSSAPAAERGHAGDRRHHRGHWCRRCKPDRRAAGRTRRNALLPPSRPGGDWVAD